MLNARRNALSAHPTPLQSLVKLGSGELETSLKDGVTRAAGDAKSAPQSTVPNRLLRDVRAVAVREQAAGRNPLDSDELQRLLECPISKDLMRQPYVDQYGHHYDAKNLKDWLDLGNCSTPSSRQAYAKDQAVGVQDPLARALVQAVRARRALLEAPGVKQMRRGAALPEEPHFAQDDLTTRALRHSVPCVSVSSIAFGALWGILGSAAPAAAVVGTGIAVGTLTTPEARAWLAGQLHSTAQALESVGPVE